MAAPTAASSPTTTLRDIGLLAVRQHLAALAEPRLRVFYQVTRRLRISTVCIAATAVTYSAHNLTRREVTRSRLICVSFLGANKIIKTYAIIKDGV